ncbi:putative ABC exporter [Natranaerovirga hydrolytica]|uniref:Putative ABC exporter n=1 Tax=Natranaerovirga hydrolytica TaxID=680378 RepID=A0A4R1N0Z6_9FIRM|nr:hypothetical protein [Natranaerovirga hydrolytica]TCK98610.1 putative ABC exporter [Natranaerovirga hydrolytica]
MSHLNFFIKLNWLKFKNKHFLTKKDVSKTITGFITTIILEIVAIVLIKKFFVDVYWQEHIETFAFIVPVVFLLGTLFVFSTQFFDSIKNIIPKLYKSPDLNYLVSLPISSSEVFAFKFLGYVFNSIKKSFLFALPLFIIAGMELEAGVMYYVILLPTYIFLSLIPSALGVGIGLLGLKFLSLKVFNLVLGVLNFVVSIFFWIVAFGLSDEVMEKLGLWIAGFLENEWLVDIIPITSPVTILSAALFGEYTHIIRPLLFLILISIITFVLLLRISKNSFYQGWYNSNFEKVKKKKKKRNKKQKNTKTNHKIRAFKNPVHTLVWYDWKLALRNKEMFFGVLMFVVIFFALVVAFTVNQTNLFFMVIIGIAASYFNVFAASIPLIPIELAEDKSLYKGRYWLNMIMPVKGKAIFDYSVLTILLPAYVLSVIGVIIYWLFSEINFLIILISLLIIFLVLLGNIGIQTYFELKMVDKYYNKKMGLGSVISFFLPILYHIIACGPLLLYYLKVDMGVNVKLNRINFLLANNNLLIALLFAIVIPIITIIISRNLSHKVWEKIEI